mgnify:CR=1 FL=1
MNPRPPRKQYWNEPVQGGWESAYLPEILGSPTDAGRVEFGGCRFDDGVYEALQQPKVAQDPLKFPASFRASRAGSRAACLPAAAQR